MNSNLLGAKGEQSAARFLRKEGYEIISANYKTLIGEIDIVAQKDNVVCFVEVKTRQEGGMFPPSAAVDIKKQENIKSSVANYVNKYKIKNEIRYDIIEVLVNGNTVTNINHIKTFLKIIIK